MRSPERTPAEWQETLEHLGRARMPWFLTPGNHDINSREMYDYWRQKLGRTYYSFDRQGCHFLILNTEEGEGSGKTGFTTAQVERVKQIHRILYREGLNRAQAIERLQQHPETASDEFRRVLAFAAASDRGMMPGR